MVRCDPASRVFWWFERVPVLDPAIRRRLHRLLERLQPVWSVSPRPNVARNVGRQCVRPSARRRVVHHENPQHSRSRGETAFDRRVSAPDGVVEQVVAPFPGHAERVSHRIHERDLVFRRKVVQQRDVGVHQKHIRLCAEAALSELANAVRDGRGRTCSFTVLHDLHRIQRRRRHELRVFLAPPRETLEPSRMIGSRLLRTLSDLDQHTTVDLVYPPVRTLTRSTLTSSALSVRRHSTP